MYWLKRLRDSISTQKNFLCIGLDPDIQKLPVTNHGIAVDVESFCKEIIDATQDYCIAYKINTAFFEALGFEGFKIMENVVNYIPNSHFKIADAKRADIGNTSKRYAEAFFKELPFDAITLNPYLGIDSLTPFDEFPNKALIILAATSNLGGNDFQNLISGDKPLYLHVVERCVQNSFKNDVLFVAGATHPQKLVDIRNATTNNFLLIPGFGTQGGSLNEIFNSAVNNKNIDILVNSSRAIIYASNAMDFAEKAREEASKVCEEMSSLLGSNQL